MSQPEAQPLNGSPSDYDGLLDLIGDANVVLIGEASHGTHEFYRECARITRRLIEERGFRAVSVEADWPDAYRVNRYVRRAREDADAEEALRLWLALRDASVARLAEVEQFYAEQNARLVASADASDAWLFSRCRMRFLSVQNFRQLDAPSIPIRRLVGALVVGPS